jgi:hypothetical protein
MNTKTVVVAEDEPLIRLLVAGAMTDAGFDVLEAGHAEDALRHLQSQFATTIHLLFTDIHIFPGFARLLASPRAHYLGGPYTQRVAWGAFCHDIACWVLFGHGGLMVDLRITGESVGQVRINDGPLFPEKELGWQLYEGQAVAERLGATLDPNAPKPNPGALVYRHL